ncbi:MAG: SDR family oxidoreductase [Clostridiales bacterium]|jgi:3-oxoacyl-[acyl-carrier protein] reductase|nr:SDR family oxidoreductase [Clostridiales bacterium]
MKDLVSYGIEGKVAVVTGAGKGIGRETAIQLAKMGAKVALFGRGAESINLVKKEIEAFSDDVIAVVCDVGYEDAVKKAVAEVIEKWGRIDILVNDAGIEAERAPGQVGGDFFDTLTEEQYFSVLRTNMLGHYYMFRNVIPHMQKNHYGRIVNVTSVTGLNGGFGSPAYTGSKAAAMCQSKAFARKYAPDGILINAVAPGMVDTPMHKDTPRHMFDEVAQRSPFGRVAQPIDIARIILFLCREDLYLVGQVIVCDGGNYI